MDGAFVVSYDPASAKLARDEVRRDAPGARLEDELSPGVSLAMNAPGLVERWRRRPPIFVRHLFPVQVRAEDVGSVADLARRADPDLRFAVQTRVLVEGVRPRDVNETLAEHAPAPIDVRHPEQVLSVVVTRTGVLAGLSRVEDNLSAWAGGACQLKRDAAQVSRSELKLLEAVDVLDLRLPSSGLAIDLGAAPGGWTRLLRAGGLRVVAVDPASLHPSVAEDPGVDHQRERAQTFLHRSPRADVLVNDMRMDAQSAARLVASYADVARRGAVGLTTLKLPSRQTARALAESLRILRARWEVPAVRQLFHNRGEATAVLRKT